MTPDEAINGLVDRITELDELVELRNRQIGDLVRKSEEDADRIAELERVIDACVAHLEASEQDGVAAITVLQMLEGVREKSAINPSTDIAQPLAVTEEPMTEANQIPVGLCDEIGILLATVDLPPAARATLKRCRAALGAQPPAATDEQKAEHVLAKAGVFAGHEGLRQFAECQHFWDKQPYGTRLYFDDSAAYLHRGVLEAAIQVLDEVAAQPTVVSQPTAVTTLPDEETIEEYLLGYDTFRIEGSEPGDYMGESIMVKDAVSAVLHFLHQSKPPAVTDEQIVMICEAIRKAGMALISKEHALLMLEAQQLMGGSVSRKVMEDELREAIAALQGEGEKG